VHSHSEPHSHTHDHDHDHSHGHHHHHHEVPENFTKAFVFGIILNSLFVIVEAFYGLRINSLALLSDAGHNLGDVLGLVLALAAESFIRKKAFGRFTYGLKASSNLIAFFNTALLIFAMGAISWEAIRRFASPQPIDGLTVSAVAAFGILINGITAILFYSGRKGDVNIRSTFQHMAGDALVSLGVVIAGIIIYYTNLLWIDPALSLVIVIVILVATWQTAKDAAHLLLDAAPASVNMDKIREFLLNWPGVTGIHDLHIWNISTKEIALTAHLVVPGYDIKKPLVHDLEEELQHHYKIGHVTIQVESEDDNCEQVEC
jgi:cobalt-zinc-cadmium efflux system protein